MDEQRRSPREECKLRSARPLIGIMTRRQPTVSPRVGGELWR
jgi:hypothetical protein